MSQSTISWRQGSQLQQHHIRRDRVRILLIGDSVIAGTGLLQIFNEHAAEALGEGSFEIVDQITTEGMGWRFLLFLADDICVDVDLVFVFLHAAETIAEPSEFRHVHALLSYIDAHTAADAPPHIVVFRTPTGSSYGEFKRELCSLEERVHRELGASLVEIASPQEAMRADGTHYTPEGLLDLSRAVVGLCGRLRGVREFHEADETKCLPAERLTLDVVRKKTARSGSSADICRLYLDPAFRDVEYLLPHESIRVVGVGRDVLCLCFIGPYSGTITVSTASGLRAITLSDPWCTVSRPQVISLSHSTEHVEHDLEITLTDQIPKVKKYTLSERFDHEPAIDQSKRSFELSLSDYAYAGPTLFPFVAFCIVDY